MTGVLEFLKSIPDLLGLVQQIIIFFARTPSASRAEVIADAREKFAALNNAGNSAERAMAAQELQKLLNKKLCIVFLFLLFAGCTSVPPKATELKLTVCVSDPSAAGFQCSKYDNTKEFIPYAESANFVAFSPEDSFSVVHRLIECKYPEPAKP